MSASAAQGNHNNLEACSATRSVRRAYRHLTVSRKSNVWSIPPLQGL